MVAFENQVIEFLGVTTGSSSVLKLFPSWAHCIGRALEIRATDMPLQADASSYRDFVRELRQRYPTTIGALVTSHKASLYDAAHDLFDIVTPVATSLGEIGMIYWRDGTLVGDANDAVSTHRVASRLLIGSTRWRRGTRRALILGGGGAGLALARALATNEDFGCTSITLTEIDPRRVQIVAERIRAWNSSVQIHVEPVKSYSDELVADVGMGGLIANATGLGKDRPGSPISEGVAFPMDSHIWEFNYRFRPQDEPTFLDIALHQAGQCHLTIEDGWDYFIWGWLVVMTYATQQNPTSFYDCFARAANGGRVVNL